MDMDHRGISAFYSPPPFFFLYSVSYTPRVCIEYILAGHVADNLPLKKTCL